MQVGQDASEALGSFAACRSPGIWDKEFLLHFYRFPHHYLPPPPSSAPAPALFFPSCLCPPYLASSMMILAQQVQQQGPGQHNLPFSSAMEQTAQERGGQGKPCSAREEGGGGQERKGSGVEERGSSEVEEGGRGNLEAR
eukprot:751374-Hanusia_phi.AAC.1